MRVKAALIIVAIAFLITAANFGSSLIFTRQTLVDTMMQDISLARDFVEDIVSMEKNLLESNAQTLAERLAKADSGRSMEQVMHEQIDQFPKFISLTVFDHEGVVAEYGDSPTSITYLNNSKYLQSAFNGDTVTSTTRYYESTDELVFHICTPIDENHVLSVTIPGMVFARLLDGKNIYQTGQIFMLDEDGVLIADYHTDMQAQTGTHHREDLIATRTNYLEIPTLARIKDKVDFFNDALSQHEGSLYYFYDDQEYICSYKSLSSSKNGWVIGVTAPLSESPVGDVRNRLLLLAALFFGISAIIAFLASKAVVKPYNKISEQNHRLEELNEINKSHSDAIREAHQRAKIMMDATPISAMLWDKDLNIFDCNEGSVNLFNMKDKQDFLDHFYELSPEYQPDGQLSAEKSMKYLNKTFADGRCSFEWMHRLPDGTLMPCEMTLIRVKYGGENIVAAYALDLREHRRMMEETLRLNVELKDALNAARVANITKDSFLANMSHEMRTPLNAIIGLTELSMGAEGVNDELAERLEKIYSSGTILLGIVNDILDISKMESGKFEINPVKYDTPSLINDLVTLNIIRVGEKLIEFKLFVDDELPTVLIGDDLRIKQIFNNLLSNAFKYTNAGTVEWHVSFELDGDCIWLVSSIKDSGIGIKPEDIDKLFMDYTQVNASTNRKVEGTGLGLAITKRLVDMIGGSINVESVYGKGTTFHVRIRQSFKSYAPIGHEVARRLMDFHYAVSKRESNAKLMRVNLSYARVLVVDDVPTNLDVAKGMMKPYGLQVDCASSGRQAIELIRAENPRYNAVFMDHMMPDMDGVEATLIIRNEIGTQYAKEIPIIALTANAVIGNEEMFLHKGFQAFISKPIDIMKLDSVLRSWVRDKELEKQFAEENACQLNRITLNDDEGGGNSKLKDIIVQGLDTQSGLRLFGHDEGNYISVLHSYAVNTRPLLERMNESLAADNLGNYAIAVHGVKGSSYGICAQEIGKAAESLEFAAKAGNSEAVKAGHDGFIKAAEAFIESLSAALASADEESGKLSAARPDPALLKELRESCALFDIRKVDEIMAQVESFRYEKGEKLIVWLHEQIIDMNFEKICKEDWPFADEL